MDWLETFELVTDLAADPPSTCFPPPPQSSPHMNIFQGSLVVAGLVCSSVDAFKSYPTPVPGAGSLLLTKSCNTNRVSWSCTGRRARQWTQPASYPPPLALSPEQQQSTPSSKGPSWLLLSSRTVDAEVVDVVDVTEEEDLTGRIGDNRSKRRPAAEIAKDVRGLVEEAVKLVREAGPRSVSVRGIRASRCMFVGVEVGSFLCFDR